MKFVLRHMTGQDIEEVVCIEKDAFYPLNQINICQIRQFQNLVDAMMAVTSTKTFLTV